MEHLSYEGADVLALKPAAKKIYKKKYSSYLLGGSQLVKAFQSPIREISWLRCDVGW